MTKTHTFRFSLSDAHTQKIKRARLVKFVLKVPVTMDQFSNLWWQETDWYS